MNNPFNIESDTDSVEVTTGQLREQLSAWFKKPNEEMLKELENAQDALSHCTGTEIIEMQRLFEQKLAECDPGKIAANETFTNYLDFIAESMKAMNIDPDTALVKRPTTAKVDSIHGLEGLMHFEIKIEDQVADQPRLFLFTLISYSCGTTMAVAYLNGKNTAEDILLTKSIGPIYRQTNFRLSVGDTYTFYEGFASALEAFSTEVSDKKLNGI